MANGPISTAAALDGSPVRLLTDVQAGGGAAGGVTLTEAVVRRHGGNLEDAYSTNSGGVEAQGDKNTAVEATGVSRPVSPERLFVPTSVPFGGRTGTSAGFTARHWPRRSGCAWTRAAAGTPLRAPPRQQYPGHLARSHRARTMATTDGSRLSYTRGKCGAAATEG